MHCHFLSHKRWPLLLSGSIRSSSLSGWYEEWFKPTALQVPRSPLRPYEFVSGFSGQYGSTCWCKTGRNCISQDHRWKLAYLLRPFASLMGLLRATAMSILGWWRPVHVHPSQLKHKTVVHTEWSWNLQTENRVWRPATLSQKLLETETHAKLKISTPFLRA